MTVAFRAAGPAAESTLSSTITLTAPTCSAGDILIAVVGNLGSTTFSTIPAGSSWNYLTGQTANQTTAILWKIARASDSGASFTWVTAGSQAWNGVILAYSGAEGIEAFAVVNSTATPPSVTSTRAQGRFVQIGSFGSGLPTVPTGYTRRYSHPSGNGLQMAIDEDTTTYRNTGSNSGSNWSLSSGTTTSFIITEQNNNYPSYISSFGADQTAHGNLTINYPSDVQAGELLILDVISDQANAGGFIPTGWTRLNPTTAGIISNGSWYHYFFAKVVASDTSVVVPSNYENASFTDYVHGVVHRFKNAKLSTVNSTGGFAVGTASTAASAGGTYAAIAATPAAAYLSVMLAVQSMQSGLPSTNPTQNPIANGYAIYSNHPAETAPSAPNNNRWLTNIHTKQFGAGVTAASWVQTFLNSLGKAMVTFALEKANNNPNVPGSMSPTGSAVIDRTAIQRFSWVFSDPDAGDTQAKFDLQYRLVGAGSWTQILNQVTTNQFYDFAANFFAAGNYEWQIQTYDSWGAASGWSASSFFSAATPPVAPTITAPANGSLIGGTPTNVTWSYPTQQGYQVRKVADLAGVPDTGTVYYDSGQITDTSTKTLAVAFPVNSRFEHVQVRIKDSGLWSPWASVRIQVSYNPPPAPTGLTVTPTPAGGYVDLAWVNPAPGGGQVAISYVEVYRLNTSTGEEKRLATQLATTSFRDWTAAGKISYQYRVVAYGSNGVSASSAQVAGTLLLHGVWLSDPDSPASTIKQFRWDGHGRSVDREIDSAEFSYAGRTNPTFEWGLGERTTISITLPLDDDTSDQVAMNNLLTLRKPLLYRDGRGRKFWVVMASLPGTETVYGAEMDLQALVVDGTDAV
jgi:hypothetical protein